MKNKRSYDELEDQTTTGQKNSRIRMRQKPDGTGYQADSEVKQTNPFKEVKYDTGSQRWPAPPRDSMDFETKKGSFASMDGYEASSEAKTVQPDLKKCEYLSLEEVHQDFSKMNIDHEGKHSAPTNIVADGQNTHSFTTTNATIIPVAHNANSENNLSKDNTNTLPLHIIYQSLCATTSHSKAENMSLHASTFKFPCITSAFEAENIEHKQENYFPCIKEAARDSEVDAEKDFVSKYNFLGVILASYIESCDGSPDIIVIGELSWSFAPYDISINGNTYEIRSSVCTNNQNHDEQHSYTMLVKQKLNKNIPNLTKCSNDGGVYFKLRDITYFFVHIRNKIAKNTNGYEEFYSELLKDANPERYFILMGDTNEGQSGNITNFKNTTHNSSDSEASQGEGLDHDEKTTRTVTGGGKKAYHDTVYTNLNLVRLTNIDDNSIGATLKKNLKKERPTVVACKYLSRVVEIDGKKRLFTDHVGLYIIVSRDSIMYKGKPINHNYKPENVLILSAKLRGSVIIGEVTPENRSVP